MRTYTAQDQAVNSPQRTRAEKPKPDSQQGRILALLESAHGCGNALTCPWTACGRVSLPKILGLYISQYSARLHELRHDWGYLIENGKADDEDHSHTWFRLSGRRDETTLNLLFGEVITETRHRDDG